MGPTQRVGQRTNSNSEAVELDLEVIGMAMTAVSAVAAAAPFGFSGALVGGRGILSLVSKG